MNFISKNRQSVAVNERFSEWARRWDSAELMCREIDGQALPGGRAMSVSTKTCQNWRNRMPPSGQMLFDLVALYPLALKNILFTELRNEEREAMREEIRLARLHVRNLEDRYDSHAF